MEARTRPDESHSGAQENIIAGPYPPILYVLKDRDAKGVEREETWEGVSRQHPTRGPGERRRIVSSPSGVQGDIF